MTIGVVIGVLGVMTGVICGLEEEEDDPSSIAIGEEKKRAIALIPSKTQERRRIFSKFYGIV